MKKAILQILGIALVVGPAVVGFAQGKTKPTAAYYITKEEVDTVNKTPGVDRTIKVMDIGDQHFSVGIIHRGSTTAPAAAVSPYKRSTSQIQKSQDVTPRRGQSTAAAKQADRPTPSPAFNREETSERFAPKNTPEMDHSFVGMKGGEIFHEMMLRHNVKHICEWPPQTLTLNDSH